MAAENSALIANIEVQIAKLDSEAWPGLLDPERDRLILINEKEELLKELQYVTPCKRAPSEAEKIESEKKRLEKDLQAARDNQSKVIFESFLWALLVSGPCGQLSKEHLLWHPLRVLADDMARPSELHFQNHGFNAC
uniref:WWC1-like helical hairpin domain-containing protein n=1 Tax=Sinocyclocheilus anshuiensis TaxID=1608454 RepID=A0A671RZX6_9TELE